MVFVAAACVYEGVAIPVVKDDCGNRSGIFGTQNLEVEVHESTGNESDVARDLGDVLDFFRQVGGGARAVVQLDSDAVIDEDKVAGDSGIRNIATKAGLNGREALFIVDDTSLEDE